VLALEDFEEGRIRITAWVPAWKRIFSFHMNGGMIGEGVASVEDVIQHTKNRIHIQDTLTMNYKTFPQQARWMDRILFQIIDGDKASPAE
jgi:endo-beta-N-acetylglucosaminidase D